MRSSPRQSPFFILQAANSLGKPGDMTSAWVFQIKFVYSPGELMTTASWVRKFVTSHPEYHHDSVVSDKINYDLFRHMKAISEGLLPCPELLGKLVSRSPKEYQVVDCPHSEAKPGST